MFILCVLQGMDMMHEEVIRLQLLCLEKKVLVKNEITGSYERDDAVFQAMARWLGDYGGTCLNKTGLIK